MKGYTYGNDSKVNKMDGVQTLSTATPLSFAQSQKVFPFFQETQEDMKIRVLSTHPL